ncbi:MAG: PIN domain nuclease [Hyphomicrobiales bacterium]|nr:PIN domain nuclease [Hyphomicrobiales bacterium]
MIVVDSSVWIDFLNGNETPEVGRLSALLGTEPLLVGDVILLEVLQGVHSETDASRVEAALRRFDVVPMLDTDLAVIAATHYRRLRTLGITVRKTIGLIIGTFCISGGHVLLTADRDFAPMAEHLGLTLV